MDITDRLQTSLEKRMRLPVLSQERLEEAEMIERGMLMLTSLESRKQIWDLASRGKARKWTNWIDAKPYRYDDPKVLRVSYREENFQPIMSFGVSRFAEGQSGMFEMRSEHVVTFRFAPSGNLIREGDTFDDCPESFSTTEFIAIAPDSLSCWSNQVQYPSDLPEEAAGSCNEFAKEFLAHRLKESRSRPELDEETHLMKGRAFKLFRNQTSYLGEKPMTFAGTISAHIYS